MRLCEPVVVGLSGVGRGLVTFLAGNSICVWWCNNARSLNCMRSAPVGVFLRTLCCTMSILTVLVFPSCCPRVQGTNASHLAQCLGLDASRYGHSGSGNTSMAAALREEALQVRG